MDIAKGKADSAKALVEELMGRSASLEKERNALAERRDAVRTQLQLLIEETQARDAALAQVNGATARVTQARVVVAEARLQLDRMTIVAPVDGRVFRLFAHPGARIGTGMAQMPGHDGSTVITMYQPDKLQVRVDTRFEDIPKVSLGQPVEINNPALSSALTGKVLFVSSEADIQKNTLQVKVEIPNPPEVFKPEMLVDVTFLSGPQSQSENQQLSNKQREVARMFVPQHLVQINSDESFVWIADRSQQIARRQTIQTKSSRMDGMVEVTRGLDVSSRLISSGVEALTDGCRIRITGDDASIGTTPNP